MAVNIKKGDVLGAINLTPMIDCVFLLLIFFLVATRFEEAEREMSVVLPQASEAMPITARPKELFVNVTAAGGFVVDGAELNEEQLLDVLVQAQANNPGRQKVIIRGDRGSPLEASVRVMDLCNRASIREYTLSTLPPAQ